MKILNLLVISASVIANFGINSSFAADNNINNQINNQLNDQININNQNNIAVQPQVQATSEINALNNNAKKTIKIKRSLKPIKKTININNKNVKLSKRGIHDIRLNLYKSFFSKDSNKFKSYEDLMFAPTFLGKLVKHFHDQVRGNNYTNSRAEIRRIKGIFRIILDNIIKKTTESINTHYFTKEETNKISERIIMASETIKISNKSNAPRIKMWDGIYR